LSADTVMALMNAIYFKGQWEEQFDPKATRDMPFYNNGKEAKNIPTMSRKAEVNYGEVPSNGMTAIELPYKGNASFIILLPKKRDGLKEMMDSLEPNDIRAVLRNSGKREVYISLPRFKLETEIDLKEKMQGLGLNSVFNPTLSDLGGISSRPLVVSKAKHKAFLEVNEEGSEAAAVTFIGPMIISAQYIPQLKVEHPFAFVIIDKLNNLPLFVGAVNKL